MKLTVNFVLILYAIVACKSQEIESNRIEIESNPHRGENDKAVTFASIEGIAAKNIIKTTYATNSLACTADCLSHPTCQSFNFQKNGCPKHLCELSESVIVSSPKCQESRPGYIFFFPIQVPPTDCSVDGMACKNGGTCIDDGCRGHVCKCEPFYTGKYCEKWKTDVSSCKDIFKTTSFRENKAYIIKIDNKPTSIYCHLSDDICEGGGWTLAMKTNGILGTFMYTSSYWSNKESYNPTAGQTGFDKYETKMPSYWSMPFDKLCVGFKFNNVLKWAVIPYKASSLYDVFADGKYRPTNISKSTWMSLIGGSELQANCNQQGFNVYHTRLGIRSNDEHDCHTILSSVLGFGLRYTAPSCGNYCWKNNVGCSGSYSKKAMGYLMIH